jgi:hypothetical protein
LRASDVQRTPAAPILFLWSDVLGEVAFVTCRKLPEMHADDRLAEDVLRDRGIPVVSAVWDDPAVDWRRYGCVVIRSAWDYILSLSPSPLLYARVDGVERARGFLLMELEINEPFLFLGTSENAAVRFADAIEAVL